MIVTIIVTLENKQKKNYPLLYFIILMVRQTMKLHIKETQVHLMKLI